MPNKIKENWNKVDERCPLCNNVTKQVKGFNKQNLKKLFSKPSIQDVVVFIMLIACLFLTWAYYHEVSEYKAIINEPGEFCINYYNYQRNSLETNVIKQYEPLDQGEIYGG